MSTNFYLHVVSTKEGIELVAGIISAMAKTYVTIPSIVIRGEDWPRPMTKKRIPRRIIRLGIPPHQDQDESVPANFDEWTRLVATWGYCSCSISIFNQEKYVCDIDIYLERSYDYDRISDFFKSTKLAIIGPSVKRDGRGRILPQEFVEFISLFESLFRSEHFLASAISLEAVPLMGSLIAIVSKKGIAISDTRGMIHLDGGLLGCSDCDLFLDRIDRI